jgi:transketolase
MGCAPIAHVLYSKIMKYDPKDPKWLGRDRFVLSNGHASALLYTMLHLTGYEGMTMDDLKVRRRRGSHRTGAALLTLPPTPPRQSFRKLHSVCAGHPENILHPAIEVSTGPLGQGISNAVGMAMGEAHLAATFNKPGHAVVDNFTYVLCGDGCLQEGVSAEASSLAGHLGLGKLIVCYDDNKITIDGPTDLSFTEDVGKRYEAYGWHVQTVPDGNTNHEAIEAAIRAAQAVTDRPSLIKIATTIGFGSKHANSHTAHGAPLGADDVANVKKFYGFDPALSFNVDADVRAHFDAAGAAGTAAAAAWKARFAAYAAAFPAEAAELARRFEGRLPAGWKDKLPRGALDAAPQASRNHSGAVLNALKDLMPELIGGSADLTPSNMTALKGVGDFQRGSYAGRYVRFGVREHAMAAICNGLHAYGGFVPFCATFLNFVGYAAGAVRLSALSHMRVLYIATHDSIQLGEDGPTHQPVEMLLSLRATPNMLVLRPADASETSACCAIALEAATTPSTIALGRSPMPNFPGSSFEKAQLGGYFIFDSAEGAPGAPAVVVAATGTEVIIAIEGAKKLAAEAGVRVAVASFPCLEVFERQSLAYRASVLPPGVPVVSIEASASRGWERYAHAQIGLTTFGASAPAADNLKYFGFTAENVAAKGKALLAHFGAAAPTLPVNAPVF